MVQENREAFADSPIKDLQKPQIETYFSEIVYSMFDVLPQRADLEFSGIGCRTGSYQCQRPRQLGQTHCRGGRDWQKPWKPTIYTAAKGTVLIIAFVFKLKLLKLLEDNDAYSNL
jgi:hypothetical protein